MASRGIIYTKIEQSKSYKIADRDDYHFVEFTNLGDTISVFVDEECLDKGTLKPKATIDGTQWIIIEETVWTKLLAEHNKETGKQSYGDSALFEKIQKQILWKSKGAKASVKISEMKTPPTPGNIYLLMPYTHYPEFRYRKQIVKIVYLKEPHIRYVYVDPPSQENADIPLASDTKLHLYGMHAEINISTHLIPDFRKRGNLIGEKVSADIHGEIFFLKDGKETTVDRFTTTIEDGGSVYNRYKQIKVYINPEWRNAEGTHKEKHQPQKYYVRLMVTAKNTFSSSGAGKPFDFSDSIRGLLNPVSYNTNTDFKKWYIFDSEQENWIEMDMQPYIEVRWDTMEMIFKKFEQEKNNQIQYIGDIEYTKKEYDPCGYSKITIKDEDDKKREPLVIFDEEATVIDKTSSYFEITSGEKPKSISIKVGNLHNQGVYCYGSMLGEGQKHSDKTNVFQVERAAFSAQKDNKGNYITEKDKTHEDQLKKAGTPITKENKHDTDHVKNSDNSQIRPVNSVMRWQQGTEYTYKGEDEITLQLKYRYNKTLTLANDEFDPNFVGNLFEEAWLFNYLWLNIDQQKQVYYIPISTCRYPNQIAKINVLPDLKWTLLFKLNYKDEDFKKFKEEHNYEVQAFFAQTSETTTISTPSGSSTTRRTSTAAGVRFTRTTTVVPVERKGGIKRLIEIIKRIEVSLTAEWKDAAGKKQNKDIIEGFLKQIYNFFAKISDIAKLVGDLTEGDANPQDTNNKKQLDKEIEKMLGGRSLDGAWNALNKKTTATEVLYPSIAIAASWYYADADDPKRPQLMGRKSLQIDAKVEAAPIIGVEVKWDFLEMLARRHPLAFIIKKGIDLLLYLSDPKNKIDITFKLSGELGLTAKFNHNMLAGNAYSNGRSPKKQELISGGATVKANLQGNITLYMTQYLIISEYKMGGAAKIGVKAEVANKVYLGADTDGLYLANSTSFDGFTFYLEAEAKMEVTFLGAKIMDWQPKYEPEPLNWGKCSLDSIKTYLNNPNKKPEFYKFNSGDDE
jgi:hypothetical protein